MTYIKYLFSYIKYLFSYNGKIYLFLILSWCRLLLNFAAGAIDHVPLLSPISHLFRPLVLVIAALACFSHLKKYIRYRDLLFYILCLVFFLMNYVLYPSNERVLDNYADKFLLFSLPFFFIGLPIDISKCYKPFYVCSVICILVQGVYSFGIEQITHGSMADNELASQMSTAYSILPHVVMVTWHSMRSFKWYNLIPTLLGLFLLLSFGNRGSVTCVLIFCSCYILLVEKGKKRIILLIMMFVIGYVLTSFFVEIIFGLQGIFSEMGMSSRLSDLFIENETFSDKSAQTRLELINKLSDAVTNGGPFGYGIGGDQILTGGMYSHNIIIELLVSFGYFGGTLLIALLISLFISSLRSSSELCSRSFWFLLFSISVVQLMVSHTYLFCPEFFLFLGFCFSLKRGNRLPTPIWKEVEY